MYRISPLAPDRPLVFAIRIRCLKVSKSVNRMMHRDYTTCVCIKANVSCRNLGEAILSIGHEIFFLKLGYGMRYEARIFFLLGNACCKHVRTPRELCDMNPCR